MIEDKNIDDAPLVKALEEYQAGEKISMHMPGHKGGKGFPNWLGERLACFDVTEIPGLDNFHDPDDVILESMNACAKAFGAEKSFFLVNGSTSGIHAMLLSSFRKGDKILVARNCHMSVINGMILFGLHPVFVTPQFSDSWQWVMPVELPAWEKAIGENPDIEGVIVTSPDYMGFCTPVAKLARLLHASGKLLLVDEAHGAHFAFSRKLPETALEQGADLCVQSLHKTMPALTQSAVLHIGSPQVDANRVQRAVSMLTTTSPSYAVMASIDYARYIFEKEGEEKYEKLLILLSEMKQELSRMKNFRLIPDKTGNISRDPTRMVIDTSQSDITGHELYRRIKDKYGIVPEMADDCHVVFIVTPSDTEKELDSLKRCFIELDNQSKHSDAVTSCLSLFEMEHSTTSDIPDFWDKCVELPLDETEGYVSAGMVTPYPPGIPVICPGETINRKQIKYLQQVILAGQTIQGLMKSNGSAGDKIRVVQKKNPE